MKRLAHEKNKFCHLWLRDISECNSQQFPGKLYLSPEGNTFPYLIHAVVLPKRSTHSCCYNLLIPTPKRFLPEGLWTSWCSIDNMLCSWNKEKQNNTCIVFEVSCPLEGSLFLHTIFPAFLMQKMKHNHLLSVCVCECGGYGECKGNDSASQKPCI